MKRGQNQSVEATALLMKIDHGNYSMVCRSDHHVLNRLGAYDYPLLPFYQNVSTIFMPRTEPALAYLGLISPKVMHFPSAVPTRSRILLLGHGTRCTTASLYAHTTTRYALLPNSSSPRPVRQLLGAAQGNYNILYTMYWWQQLVRQK